jgi:protein O-GlcNAc transferase
MQRAAWREAREIALDWTRTQPSVHASQALLTTLLFLHEQEAFAQALLDAKLRFGEALPLVALEACALASAERFDEAAALLQRLQGNREPLLKALLGEQAAKLADHPHALAMLLWAEQQDAGIWTSRAALKRSIAAPADLPPQFERLRYLAMIYADDERSISQLNAAMLPQRTQAIKPRALNSKPKLAYLLPRAAEHATTVLIHELALHHQQFEPMAFVQNASGAHARLQGMPIAELAAEPLQAAAQIRAWGADIALVLPDFPQAYWHALLGHLQIPSVSYLAYVSSTAHLTDWQITDAGGARFDPQLQRVIEAPDTMYVYSRADIAPSTRAAHGLEEDARVLCAFNASAKLSPALCTSFAALLKQSSNAVLWLLKTHGELENNLREFFTAQGIPAEQIVFANPAPHAEQLGRMALADVYLDAWDYGGHTSLLDALYLGLPCVTLRGAKRVQQVGATIFQSMGLQEWIAQDEAQYLAIAQKLMQTPKPAIDAFRAADVFQPRVKCAWLEEKLLEVHHFHARGLAPD